MPTASTRRPAASNRRLAASALALFACLVLFAGLVLAPAALAGAPAAPVRTPPTHPKTQAPQGPLVSVTLTTSGLQSSLSPMPSLRFAAESIPKLPTLHVDDAVRYQHVTGFGAAMTDSSAWLLQDELSPTIRTVVMNLLFSPRVGIGLDLIRVPMGASDYTTTGVPYSYDDLPAGQTDPTLARFSIAHDEAYIIPSLQEMLAIDPHVDVLSTEWSPPAWMKTNDALDDFEPAALIPSDYQPLARYFVKFIDDYRARGIPIWAVTPENEPGAPSKYPGLALPPAAEGQFVSQDLIPALRAAGLHTRIFGGDQVSDLLYGTQLMRTAAGPELSGMAWHCYQGGEQVMSRFHLLYPRMPQIMSECSPGPAPYGATEIAISGLRNWASGIDLWNLALDPAGGPVQPPNSGCPYCTGLVTVDEHTHAASLGLEYYQLGQFSKFIRPGAVRISTERWVHEFDLASGYYGVSSGLDNVAFLDPGGTRVLVAYNNSSAPQRFAVSWHGQAIAYDLAPGATVTFTWR